ncbi:MAG: hypothetical protein GTO40_28450, partial [Deltaproteobacteria bacterium]|nr:hypothetical protein [Deltaproteobacteria bacterium]
MLILFGFGILLGGVSPTHVAQGAGNKNIWLVKTDARGNMEWNLINDFGSDDYVRAVIQTSDGGFALVGTVYSVYYGRYSPFGLLMKTDAHGVQQWVRSYAREGGDAYDCYSFSAGIQTADDGFLLAGSITNSYSENTIFSSWLVKTDAAGNKQWSGSIGDLYDSSQLNAISQTADGGFVLVGQHLTFVSWPNSWYGYYINDGWLVKLNSNGGVEWEQTYDGGADNDTVKSVTQTAGGGFLLAGSTGGAAWLIKTDASGNKIWDRTYGGGGFNTIIP